MNSNLFRMLFSNIGSGILTGIAIISFLVVVPTANAGIRCNDEFQIFKSGDLLATPWCEDQYIARIARQYGRKVSNRMMRQNPNLKEEVCQIIGHDYRLNLICHQNGSTDRGRSRSTSR